MSLSQIKKYRARCDECGKEEEYECDTEYYPTKKYRIPENWSWGLRRNYIYTNHDDKLFCNECSKLEKSKWDY